MGKSVRTRYVDSQTSGTIMKVKLLHTDGNNTFNEIDWIKPDITDNEIEVKASMTGVCRSDIDMMSGSFSRLPLHMQGHEGLGIVTKVGKNIFHVKEGDFVATRGEPAYADYYNVREEEFVVVPELKPKYILEPVACGINVVNQAVREIAERSGETKRLLILGSGFLSWVAYNTIMLYHICFGEIVVVGQSNKDIWKDKLSDTYSGKFDVIIDLSSKNDIFEKDILNNQSLVVLGVQKLTKTDFANLLWKACTVIFPSPRTNEFYETMQTAKFWIENQSLNVDNFWTKGYNRQTEWREAFEDGLNRPSNYSRGYIFW